MQAQIQSEADARALRLLLDRAAITQAVQDWGLARDTGQWAQLRSIFTEDATMHTTWFVGSATEFVERSAIAALAGARAQHFIGATSIAICGEKAISENRMVLSIRAVLHGMEVDVTCHGRFYDRFVKQRGEWRIQQRVPIYEKDRLDPLDPSASLRLDADILAAHPVGYRHIAYLQLANATPVTPDLPVPGNDALARLYAEGNAWLAQD